MAAQQRISLVTHLTLALQRGLKLGGLAPADHQPMHRVSVPLGDSVTRATGAVARERRRLDDEPGPQVIAEDVPMHHLFLLDMKIGR